MSGLITGSQLENSINTSKKLGRQSLKQLLLREKQLKQAETRQRNKQKHKVQEELIKRRKRQHNKQTKQELEQIKQDDQQAEAEQLKELGVSADNYSSISLEDLAAPTFPLHQLDFSQLNLKQLDALRQNPQLLQTPILVKKLFHEIYRRNPFAWGLTYFPERFRDKSPRFHIEILHRAMTQRKLAIAAPRESAKSSILVDTFGFHRIIFKERRFVVIVGNTYEKACEPLDTMKRELQDNEQLQRDFPNIQITRDTKGDSVFRHPDGFETRVLCKGKDQIGSIRGVKFKSWRPDLFLIDDLEDDKSVENPDLRRELRDQFDQALVPAGDKRRCQFICIGTILHYDSQLANMLRKALYTDWFKLKYQAHIDPDSSKERSLWPQKWTVSELKQIRHERPSVYAKELQNDPVSGTLRKFNKSDFRYWQLKSKDAVLYDKDNSILSRFKLSECKAAIACDLAWESKRENDFSVILPGFLTPNSDLLLYHYTCKKGMRPHEIEEIIFSLESKLRGMTGHSVYIGFEKAKLEKVIRHLLRNAMKRRNHWLIFKDLLWDADKTQRIVTRLEPLYSQHSIYHMHGMGEYETQLLQVPSGVHEDLPDASQGLVQLLASPRTPLKKTKQESMFERIRRSTITKSKPKLTYPGRLRTGKRSTGLPSKISLIS